MSEERKALNPSILFKYRGDTEFTEKIITERKIWLSTAGELNDPLECKTGTISVELKTEMIRKMEEGQLLGLVGLPFAPSPETLYSLTPRQTRQWFKRLKKLPHGRRMKAMRLLHEQHDIKLSNPKETFQIFEKQLGEVGIFSLSEESDNELMWSHYADNHRGIALGFERRSGNSLANETNTIPVDYNLEKPTFTGGAKTAVSISRLNNGSLRTEVSYSLDDPTLRASISTKTPPWGYEKEWRYVELTSGLFNFPGELAKIVFGLKMSEERRNHYRDLILSSGLTCSEAEIIVDENSQLKLVDLP